MSLIISTANKAQDLLDKLKVFDFLGPLALRIYLAPVFILAGMNKLSNVDSVVWWFDSLGLPFPELMVYLAGLTELLGGLCLVLGLAVRWVAIPLMISMIVAAVTAHWENGWHVLPETELTVPWEWRQDQIEEAVKRKEAVKSILKEHGNYNWLTQAGPVTILKNGIEFSATYFIMLLALFFTGSGKFLGIDYWLARRYRTIYPF